ncbi:hypothetical protein USDA257_c13840 [Sinorhizobium fredii USDA 257]|uniref:Uncharacterized protein n=1 Tax=Sinorhizobium fredii (strain USDA 257) TaxID=1185652 RepID=I3X269_SINF2|nr:hypothetical protein USDA257_c13840 [Sinorhizobium fredii USDA 257]
MAAACRCGLVVENFAAWVRCSMASLNFLLHRHIFSLQMP